MKARVSLDPLQPPPQQSSHPHGGRLPLLPSSYPLAAWASPCCACSDGGKCPASTTRLPACPCCTHRPGPASTHPHGRHPSISRFTHTPYHRRTPSFLSPSPFQAASCSSHPPPPLSGTRASRRFERQMASERHRSNPLSSAHPSLYPRLPPPAALATSLQSPDHWQQSPATSMETD